MGYQITDAQRDAYWETSTRSRARKALAQTGVKLAPVHPINAPRFDPAEQMPQRTPPGLRALSLFSGGGGLDLGFERAGFEHIASYDILDICGDTLSANRPDWCVRCGARGDVSGVDWNGAFEGVDVLHGGPKCQPFSVAGRQRGRNDERDMWPEFNRAIHALRPAAFVAENVPGLIQARFAEYVSSAILQPLEQYIVRRFVLNAADYGVPQTRRRVFFIGFASPASADRFRPPVPTHGPAEPDLFALPTRTGIGSALGLPDIGYDEPCPTLRSGFTGPRKTTGVINSKASLDIWSRLKIWPHGVAASREAAHRFPPENGHFRRARYTMQRGATLNNPHVSKRFLQRFAAEHITDEFAQTLRAKLRDYLST